MCSGVDKGLASSKLAFSRKYPPISGKKNMIIEKTIMKTPMPTSALSTLYGKNGTLSKGTPSSSTCFSISMPSGFPAPTSCSATRCMNTKAINIKGSATTCNAKNLDIVAPDI